MDGQQNFVLPFIANPAGISQYEEVVVNGLSANRLFREESIYLSLGANFYSLLVNGDVRRTRHLSDAQAVNIFPGFEPE